MLRRILLTLAVLVPTLVLSGLGVVLWLAFAAQPDYSGVVPLAGPSAQVAVTFGPHAVPSIRADNADDLAYGQGYVVAGERMWQMDMMRRLAEGRLAEVIGPKALVADRLFRTLGLAVEARRSLADLDPSQRALLDAYAAGVNAYRERFARRLPLEYRIAGIAPAPWSAEDSLAIGAYMAWTQSYNLRAELAFLRIAARVGAQRARELFPVDPGVSPPPPPDLPADALEAVAGTAGTGSLLARFSALLDTPAQLGLPIPTATSNAWAVTGRLTADGQAMLANDPHLAASAPGIWYELELDCPNLHVAGLALPGVPLVVIGHNADLAWGFTSALADTQDIFLERPTADGGSVERQGKAPEPIRRRAERIGVRGGGAETLEVLSTSNGVVLNGALDSASGHSGRDPMALPRIRSRYLLALRETNDLPDRGFAALLDLSRAQTLEEARAAGLGFRQAALNLMLADRTGRIGWQVTGLLPRRGKGSGAFPSPGWLAGYAWQGLMPQSSNPGRIDPPGQVLITANNRTIPLDYPATVSNAWMAPYRAQRIAERIAAAPALTPDGMESIQSDRLSIQARLTQEALRRLGHEIGGADPEAWAIAQTQLLDWDGVMDGASPKAALFALLQPTLYREIYGDELGDALPALTALAVVAYNPVQEATRSDYSSFWDDIRTPEHERPAQIWARALRAAEAELERRLPDPKSRRLDRLQSLEFLHSFHTLPGLGRLFDLGPVALGGAADTVDVAKVSPWNPERILFVPSARMVQTPSDWTRSRGTLPLGQSGHLLSPYRSDQLEDWVAVRGHPWPWNGPIGGPPIGVLVLDPARPPSTP